VELRPVPWDIVAPKVLAGGRLVYDFTDPITRERRRLLDSDVLHLRDRSDDGLIGRARHDRAHPVIAAALALTEFSGNSYRNGAYPSGVLQADGKLSDDSRKRLKELFTSLFTGPSKAAKALILDQGIKWQSVSATPEDMELLAARRFAVEEAARLYQVPPPIIGDLTHGTFTPGLWRTHRGSALHHVVEHLKVKVNGCAFVMVRNRRSKLYEMNVVRRT
jgi:HK97 family phage portal protein